MILFLSAGNIMIGNSYCLNKEFFEYIYERSLDN